MQFMPKFVLLLALVFTFSSDRSANAQKGGGGGGGANNVIASMDAESGVFTVTGDSAPNLFSVSAWGSTVFIIPTSTLTKVNGQTDGLYFEVASDHLTIEINTGSGSDRVIFGSGDTQMPVRITIDGGDGADEIIVNASGLPLNYNGDLRLEGGRGDDYIELRGATVAGDLLISGGDNNDVVSIIDTTWNGGSAPTVVGLSLLDGGRGRDELYAPEYFLTDSFLANFEKTVRQ